jgi:hypothetical protein
METITFLQDAKLNIISQDHESGEVFEKSHKVTKGTKWTTFFRKEAMGNAALWEFKTSNSKTFYIEKEKIEIEITVFSLISLVELAKNRKLSISVNACNKVTDIIIKNNFFEVVTENKDLFFRQNVFLVSKVELKEEFALVHFMESLKVKPMRIRFFKRINPMEI